MVLCGLQPAAADTLAPPPTELFVSGSAEQPVAGAAALPLQAAPEKASSQQREDTATTAAVTPAGASAPSMAPSPADNVPPVPLLSSIPWTEPIDEEQPAPIVQAVVPPPPPPTPAELLGLVGKERAKAERCLANAVYFEARGEPLRGQVAVAQVVLNRVFSPYYPKDVCSVVYQNADRHLACQFTFACDGKSKAINDRRAWWRAMRVARLMLDGKVWLAAVAKSTHYHANYVSPAWTSEMRKMYRYGVHLFYRPYRWGDGEKELGWVQAPLPMLKPKGQSKPTAGALKPQTLTETRVETAPQATSATSRTAGATALAKVDTASVSVKAAPAAVTKNPTQPKAQGGTAATAKAAPGASTSRTDGKPKPAEGLQTKGRSENAADKPVTKRAKPATSQPQAGGAQRISLN